MKSKRYHYISYGREAKMYTLREYFTQPEWIRGEGGVAVQIMKEHDWHVRNLATNFDKAVEKAVAYKAENNIKAMCLDKPQYELGEIRRRNAEEIAEADMIAAEALAHRMNDHRDEEIAMGNDDLIQIANGVMPFGKKSGVNMVELDAGYVGYWLKLDEQQSPHKQRVTDALKAKLAELHPHLVKLPEANGEYFGTVKERLDITATVVKVIGFDSYFGWTDIVTLVTESGEAVTYMGGSAPFDRDDLGKKFTFKATIKSHEQYKGESQTKIQRIKLIG